MYTYIQSSSSRVTKPPHAAPPQKAHQKQKAPLHEFSKPPSTLPFLSPFPFRIIRPVITRSARLKKGRKKEGTTSRAPRHRSRRRLEWMKSEWNPTSSTQQHGDEVKGRLGRSAGVTPANCPPSVDCDARFVYSVLTSFGGVGRGSDVVEVVVFCKSVVWRWVCEGSRVGWYGWFLLGFCSKIFVGEYIYKRYEE